MITVDEALRIVLEHIGSLEAERVQLEHSLGRVLAEDIVADMDLPPFDRARMDGYALRAEDVSRAPVELSVIGEVAAGGIFSGRVGPGQAVKIFTGAPLPDGTNAVQKVELTESGNGSVFIREAVGEGQFITPRASEVRKDDIVARTGREIGPAEMAVLASFGYSQIKTSRRPRVAVMSTGSELVEVGERPSEGHIRNSNSYTIASYAREAGAQIAILPIVPDDTESTRNALLAAAENSDVVISSGGVSMGDYDLVKRALKAAGAEIYFDKVRVRPGKPIVFARRNSTFFFGLPGNPVSTSVTFNLFVRPAIRRMQGAEPPCLPVVQAEASRPLRDSSNRRSYLPGKFFVENGRARVEPLRWGGSSDFVAFMSANSLIVIPEETHEVAAGDVVDVMLLRVV